MKKVLLILILIIGSMFSTISPLAEDGSDEVNIQEEKTPEAYRKSNNQDLVVKFALFSGVIIAIGGITIAYRNRKALSLYSSELNEDGSYTITIRSNEVKKMIDNPGDVHVVIRRGSCIFLKKPDFTDRSITKNDDLFVAVVNRKSVIEFSYKDEILVVDGEKIQLSNKK